MKIITKLIHIVFVLAALLLLSTCSKPERDNPWDEKGTLNPEAWAPKNFQVEKLTITSNRLSWSYDGDNRIEGFRIDRKKGDEGWQVSIASLQKDFRNWVDENVEPNISYTYRLYAYAGNLVSNNKSLASTTAIVAPSNLQITRTSISSVTLAWVDNSAVETGFRVERRNGSGTWEVIGTPAGLTLTDASFAMNTEVYYRVCAYHGSFQSLYAENNFNSQIPVPTNLTSVQNTIISISLTWEYPIPSIEGFIIERSQGNGNWQEINQLSANERNYVDNTVDLLNWSYSYRIKAFFQNYSSLPSPVTFISHIIIPMISVPGSYQGWNPSDTNYAIGSVGSDGNYEGFIWFPHPSVEFGYSTSFSWDEYYGDNGANGSLDLGGSAIIAGAAGLYKLNVNMNSLSHTFVKTDWGIIGSATPNGWISDQDMTYDVGTKLWIITLDLVPGQFKFRANDDWSINLGDDGADGKLEYSGTNIAIAEAGNYTITLNLSKPIYTYTIVKH